MFGRVCCASRREAGLGGVLANVCRLTFPAKSLPCVQQSVTLLQQQRTSGTKRTSAPSKHRRKRWFLLRLSSLVAALHTHKLVLATRPRHANLPCRPPVRSLDGGAESTAEPIFNSCSVATQPSGTFFSPPPAPPLLLFLLPGLTPQSGGIRRRNAPAAFSSSSVTQRDK